MTIEERATSYSEMLYDEYETRLAQDTAYEGYIKGATEQREIDIEKACKWIDDNLNLMLPAEKMSQIKYELRRSMENEI